MKNAQPAYTLSNRELWQRVWRRLKPQAGTLLLSLSVLVLAVPFGNFHPLVWGFVADRLVEKTLTPEVLGIMLATYLAGLVMGAWQNYLLERTSQAFVRDIRTGGGAGCAAKPGA